MRSLYERWKEVPASQHEDLLRAARAQAIPAKNCTEGCLASEHVGPTGEAVPPCPRCQTAVFELAYRLAELPG